LNILKAHLRQSVITLLERGCSNREIARRLEINRKTVDLTAKDISKRAGVATGSGAQNGPISPTHDLYLKRGAPKKKTFFEWLEGIWAAIREWFI
jgi:hypothetical protein